MGKIKLSIVIPAYNEGSNIGQVLDALLSTDIGKESEIIVVDDGSTDDTAKIAQAKGAKLIQHPYNKGNGAAIKTGIRNASGEIILFMDADGQNNISDINNMLEYMDKYDMVVAARGVDYGRSFIRKTANRFLNILAGYISGFRIPDLTSGFRIAKRSIMKEFLHILPNGFSYPTTSTLAFLLSGYSVKFVPTTSYTRGAGSKSKIRPFRHFFQFIIIIFRTIMLFGPLKIFLPISIILFSVGSIDLIYFFAGYLVVSKSSILFIMSGLIVFFFGLVADQVAHLRREPR